MSAECACRRSVASHAADDCEGRHLHSVLEQLRHYWGDFRSARARSPMIMALPFICLKPTHPPRAGGFDDDAVDGDMKIGARKTIAIDAVALGWRSTEYRIHPFISRSAATAGAARHRSSADAFISDEMNMDFSRMLQVVMCVRRGRARQAP